MEKLFYLLIIIFNINACSQNREQLPNIVMVIGDDHGYPYFGFMGADYVQTPQMDRLAESGILFSNGYVPANHCAPSLQTLMTGTIPSQYEREVQNLMNYEKEKGSYENLSEKDKKLWERSYKFHAMKNFMTLPRILNEKGYASFQGGKWWEFNYQNGGFTEGMTKGWTEEDEGKEDWFQKFMGGDGTELVRKTMQPVYDFIDRYNDQPIFIWFAPELPHYPLNAPEKYYNMYKDKDMSESAKRYYANCTWFDDGVSDLIDYLKEKGKFENTLFVYVNDNGWEQEPHQEFRSDSLRWHNGGDKGKLSMYDMSFRTPIIFSWKDKIHKGQSNNTLMHSADIPATILDYVGIETPEDYFGVSYKNAINGDSSPIRDEIIGRITQVRWEGDMMGRGIEGYWLRNNDWFFNWNMTNNSKSLFDMNIDPQNNTNLVLENLELVEKFSDKIIEWEKRFANKGLISF